MVLPMDYGERQDRALFLVKVFREHPDQSTPIYHDYEARPYTARDIAGHIEGHTDLGSSLVAITGFVLQAMHAKT